MMDIWQQLGINLEASTIEGNNRVVGLIIKNEKKVFRYFNENKELICVNSDKSKQMKKCQYDSKIEKNSWG